MDSRTAIVTGANRGIGHGVAKALAAKGWSLIMACRDLEKSRRALLELKEGSEIGPIDFLELDLASFRSIKGFVESIQDKGLIIDALVNNAGVLSTEYKTTAEGFELTMGVNYLGQALLARLLLPSMRKGEGRIINTSSVMYKLGRVDAGIFSRDGAGYRGFRAYADSKLALVLFSLELARRIEPDGVTVNLVDPGIVNTNMIRFHKWFDPITDAIFRPLIRSEERGADTSAFLASSLSVEGLTGKYFIDRKERGLPRRILEHPFREELWDRTGSILGID